MNPVGRCIFVCLFADYFAAEEAGRIGLVPSKSTVTSPCDTAVANTNRLASSKKAFVTGFNCECLAPQCGASANCFVLESPKLFVLHAGIREPGEIRRG